jgi:hypothetical protein
MTTCDREPRANFQMRSINAALLVWEQRNRTCPMLGGGGQVGNINLQRSKLNDQ